MNWDDVFVLFINQKQRLIQQNQWIGIIFFPEYFLAKAKGNQVKEIHFRGGDFGFFKDLFLQFYNEGVFPKLEKLIIDHDDRYGRKTIDNPCEFEMWELSHLPQILEDLAKIKYLHIWSLKTSLKVTASQKVSKMWLISNSNLI